ncbi:MAG: hypothetical protein KA201_31445 [Kofleriaceae bacterium]|nr:hypothetical protein [Kofleriaceae bacterium]
MPLTSPRSLLASALLTLATAGTALADDVPAAPASPPRFPSLAPDGAASEVAAEVGLGIYDDADDTLFSTSLTAQFMGAQHVGGYARIDAMTLDEAQAVSNLELGGLYRAAGPQGALAVRAGLVLPTGPGEDDDLADAFLPISHFATRRPSELARAIPDSTVLRLAVSPSTQSGALFARADLGIDVFIDSPSSDNPDPFYHIDLAAGLKQGAGAATIELSSVGSLGTDDSDDGTFDAITLGGQYDMGQATIGAGVTFPFDTFDNGPDLSGKILSATIVAKL